jgi:hypothetical protein
VRASEKAAIGPVWPWEKGSLPRLLFWRGRIFISFSWFFAGKDFWLITTLLPT